MGDYLKLTLLISLGLIVGFGCEDSSSGCDLASCDPEKTTVKVAESRKGHVGYSEDEEKWLIIAAVPHTYDSQDLGIVCGKLPEEFQEVGKMVQFSGEYKVKCGNNKGAIPGQAYYYLHLSEIKTLKGN